MGWVFADPGRRRKLAAVWGFLAREALVPLGHTYLLDDGCCAAWTPPHAPEWPAERSRRFGDLLAYECGPDDARRLGVLDDVLAAHHPPETLWYLGSIATTDAVRGRGLGSRLLDHTLAMVDASGLPTFLEATSPRNAALYERYGFGPIEQLTLPDGPTLVTMRREPRGS